MKFENYSNDFSWTKQTRKSETPKSLLFSWCKCFFKEFGSYTVSGMYWLARLFKQQKDAAFCLNLVKNLKGFSLVLKQTRHS